MNKALIRALWVGVVLAPLGCSKDEEPRICSDDMKIGGDCIGVPLESLCGADETCTTGQCANVITVGDQAELDGAVASAGPGTCIELEPGDYGSVLLPDGVSIFGRHPDDVRIGSVSAGGANVRIRGMEVGAGGIRIMSGDATVEGVRVMSPTDTGIDVAGSAYAKVEHSEIHAAGRYGIAAFAAGGVSIAFSRITSGGGPGLWASCVDAPEPATGCGCAAPMTVSLSSVKIDNNRTIGFALEGAQASLANVVVSGTRIGANFQHGGGAAVFGCTDMNAAGLDLSDNSDYGMLVDDSMLYIDGLTVARNRRGVWMQNIGDSMVGAGATMLHGVFDANDGVGLGIGDDSQGVLVEDVDVTGTLEIPMPILIGEVSAGVDDVGDGIVVRTGAQAHLRMLRLSGNERASIMVDGEAPATIIESITQSGGDELKGISQINNFNPIIEAGEPQSDTSVTQLSSADFKVPGNLIPPGI